jgi:hypothetical protein
MIFELGGDGSSAPRRGCILLPSNPGHILSDFQILI